jgi:lipid-A-disaccharide synthase
LNYYLVAGERSGDLHGGNLIKALKQHDSSASFKGFGGDYMQEAGLDISVHYRDMAFMGLWEFLFHLRKILHYLKKCKHEIDAYKPNAVILIDYAGFNRKIGKYCKKKGVTVFYYISPKVWAWRQSRAWALKRTISRMFVILPFEKDFFKKKVNWDVDYVGNPVLDAVKGFIADKDFAKKNSLDASKEIVALLPGSRTQELKYLVPAMAEVAAENPKVHFAVATVSNLSKSLYSPFQGLTNVSFVEEATYDLLSVAKAAIVTSGTATLETALFNVPQVVVYKTSWLNYFIGKRVVSVPFISLVNLIVNKEVVKELLQKNCTPQIISEELNNLLNNKEYRTAVLSGNEQVYKTLDIGSASENTARLMVEYLESSNLQIS